MASSTVVSCDSCGKTINEENDMEGEHIIEINVTSSLVKNGDRYIPSGLRPIEREEFELCVPCGKKAIKAMREALSG